MFVNQESLSSLSLDKNQLPIISEIERFFAFGQQNHQQFCQLRFVP